MYNRFRLCVSENSGFICSFIVTTENKNRKKAENFKLCYMIIQAMAAAV